MKSLTLKTLSVATLCTLALLGCDKKDKEQATSESTKPVVTEISNLSCDDASIKNALVGELTNVVERNIGGLASKFDGAEGLDLENKIKARLPEVAVDLQNVEGENGVCKTDLHITLPAVDLGYANRQFKAQGKPSAGEQAEAAGIKFDDNTFVSPINFRVDGGNVKLDDEPKILSIVAGATAAAAYAEAKNAPAPRQNAGATANSGASRPVAPPPAPVVKVRPKPIEPVHNPKPPKPKTDSNAKSASPSTPKAPSANTETPKTDTSTAKAETPKTETPKTEAAKTSKPKASAEKPVVKETVKDTTSEITIVETDETY